MEITIDKQELKLMLMKGDIGDIELALSIIKTHYQWREYQWILYSAIRYRYTTNTNNTTEYQRIVDFIDKNNPAHDNGSNHSNYGQWLRDTGLQHNLSRNIQDYL